MKRTGLPGEPRITRFAFALQPQSGPGLNPLRNFDGQFSAYTNATRATALLARVRDDSAASLARRTCGAY